MQGDVKSSTLCLPALALVSLESAERPNYFLYVHDDDSLSLELWKASPAFQHRATFFHHQGLWVPGYSAFELYSKKGFFLIFTHFGIKASKYDDSEEFKHSSSFSIEGMFLKYSFFFFWWLLWVRFFFPDIYFHKLVIIMLKSCWILCVYSVCVSCLLNFINVNFLFIIIILQCGFICSRISPHLYPNPFPLLTFQILLQ